MTNFISLELIDSLLNLNTDILNNRIRHPARLALLLEQIAKQARDEAKQLGISDDDAVNLPPSLRIDP